MQRRQWITLAGATLAAPWVRAQAWPAQPIKYIVPFPPGGATDAISRAVADRLQERLKQPVIVENIPGAGAAIGTARLRQAAADGYTIGLGNSASHTITPHLNLKAGYDPITDFTPISMLTDYANVLVVATTSKATNMKEFLAWGRSKPGGLLYGSAGIGSSNHLSAALLAHKTGLSMTHIPYKGSSAAMTDLLGGQVDWMFSGLSEAFPFVQDKRLRVIGVTSTVPDPLVPSVRPIGETVPGYEMAGFMGVFAPAHLPAPIAARLTSEVRAILQLPEVAQKFESQGLRVKSSSSAELAARVKKDHALWKIVIAEAGIKAE